MKMAGELEAMAKHEDKDILNGAPLQHDEGEAQGDSNRNFINKKDMPLANARGLVDLPPELKLLILEPLEFGTLLQVEKCHESFETLGHQLKVDFVRHARNAFEVSEHGLEPIWKIDPGRAPDMMSLISGLDLKSMMKDMYAMFGGAPPKEAEEKEEEPKEQPVQPIDYVMSNSLLDGRRVEAVHYSGADPAQYESVLVKVMPKFTCDNFFYIDYGNDCYLDKEILQNVLKPENVWSQILMDCLFGADFPKGSLSLDIISPEQLKKMKEFRVPRLSFQSIDWAEDILELFTAYIEEWMAGSREIETIWAERFGMEDFMEFGFCESETDVATEDGPLKLHIDFMAHYPSLTIDEKKVLRGQLQRADGNLLNIRADDDSIVLQIPGGSRRFLDRNDTYCQAPDF